MSEARRFVDTANRDPLGIPPTRLEISMPNPGRTIRPKISARDKSVPSTEEGIRPEATTAALTKPKWSLPKLNNSVRVCTSFVSPKSILVNRKSGSGMTRNQVVIGATGELSRPWTPRSTEMLTTLAPSGKSIPKKKMSDQHEWVRSSRTGVFSHKRGKRPVAWSRSNSTGVIRSGCSAAAPKRYIQRLPPSCLTDWRT